MSTTESTTQAPERPLELAAVLREERDIMNGFADHYESAIFTNAYVYQREREAFAAWVRDRLRQANVPLERACLLDVGCATGAILNLLAGSGMGQMIGLDLSPRMLDQARQRHMPNVQLLRAAIEGVPLAPQSVDVVLCVLTVHHLLDPSAFFGLVDRVLRPGGFFFVLEYDGGSGLVVPEGDRPRNKRRAMGDAVRAALAWKNRRKLDATPRIENRTNRAHRFYSFAELCATMPDRGRYAIEHRARGLLLPALLPVLVADSALDRGIADMVEAVDELLVQNRPGFFQWIEGRRQ